ncbi:MAG: 2-oxoglutarate and iron-dependent oxygenase domain-containing protein, partial [Phenylobacterium sp.]
MEPVSFTRFASDFEAFAGDLGRSFERYGFAVVADHGLPQDRIDAALAAAKAFFALPEEVKRAYVTGPGHQRGYTPFGVETAKGAAHYDLKEFWHVGRELAPGHRYEALMPPNVWPSEVPAFREAVGWLYGALDAM